MNRFAFWWACCRNNDKVLSALSLPLSQLFDDVAGKTVALVGNARALGDGQNGAAIDAADIVVRLNSAPMPAAHSHGTRTDWLAMSIPVDTATIAARAPQRLIWVTPKRKRLPWHVANDARFAMLPSSGQERLMQVLGSRPTTGMQMIDMLSQSKASKIDLWGFDFFASQSLSGGRDAKHVPHDFAAEARAVAELLARDLRFTRH